MTVTRSLTGGLIAGAIGTVLLWIVSLVAPGIEVPDSVGQAIVLLLSFGVSAFVTDTNAETVAAQSELSKTEIHDAKVENRLP